MRKCKGRYSVYENGKWEEREFEMGYFHQWGADYEEFESGPGNYSVAIVELPGGKIVTPVAQNIEFIDFISEVQ